MTIDTLRSAGLSGPILGSATIALALFGGLGAWAATAPLAGAVVAQAHIDPEGRRRVVQHFEGGMVRRVDVRDGDRVAAGDVLLVLRSPAEEAEAARLADERTSLLSRLARLEAELTGAQAMRRPVEVAEGDLFWRAEERLFLSRRSGLAAELEILLARESQAAAEHDGKGRLADSRRLQLAAVEAEMAGVRTLVDRQMAPLKRLLDLRKEHAVITGEIATAESSRAQAERQIAEIRHQGSTVEERRQEEIRKALAETSAALAANTHLLAAKNDLLARLELRAPVAGTVIGMKVNTVGSVVPRGEPILEVVPDDDELIVLARVAPNDIDEVRQGQAARIQLTAFSQRHGDRVSGTVRRVGADRQADPADGSPFFAVEVEIPPEERARHRDARSLRAGMPAEVAIVTRERTALDYLLDPLRIVLRRGMTES